MAKDTPPQASPVSELWTTRRLLGWMTGYFGTRRVDSPRLVAEWLLSHTLGCQRLRLYMEPDRPASREELATLKGLVERVARQEPVQYILGEWDFYGRPFKVAPCTLIPRPSTETLVEQVVTEMRRSGTGGPVRIADIGTGTGCIAVTFALELKYATLVATDIDEEILRLARANAERHGVGARIDLRSGWLLAPLSTGGSPDQFDVIASNPPYVPDDEWDAVESNVKEYEPHRALRGGVDGLDFIRPIIDGAAGHLTPRGLLAIEIPHARREEVLAHARTIPRLTDPRVVRDSEGLWRVLLVRRSD